MSGIVSSRNVIDDAVDDWRKCLRKYVEKEAERGTFSAFNLTPVGLMRMLFCICCLLIL